MVHANDVTFASPKRAGVYRGLVLLIGFKAGLNKAAASYFETMGTFWRGQRGHLSNPAPPRPRAPAPHDTT